jgi:hypothetical protein
MRHSSLILALAGIALAGIALAQFNYQPSCTETLKLAPDKFMQVFTERNRDESEFAQDEAGIRWAQCKHKANLERLSGSSNARERLLKLRDLENQLFTAETNLAYRQAGGGTIYPHGRARFQPYIELHIEKLIGLVTTRAGATTSNDIKMRYSKALATMNANLKRIKNPTKQDLEFTSRPEWDAAVGQYESAWTGILEIANAPDAASLEIAEFVAHGLWMNTVVNGFR